MKGCGQLQSGLDERLWSDSMECYSYLRNVQDLLADGKTPYEKRFGEPFEGPIIHGGAMVESYPSSPNDKARIDQCGKNFLPVINQDFINLPGKHYLASFLGVN